MSPLMITIRWACYGDSRVEWWPTNDEWSPHTMHGDRYHRYSGSCAVRTHSLQPTTLTKDTLLVILYSNRAPYSEQEQHTDYNTYTTAKPQTHNLIFYRNSLQQQLLLLYSVWVWTTSTCKSDHYNVSQNNYMCIHSPLTHKISDKLITHALHMQANNLALLDMDQWKWLTWLHERIHFKYVTAWANKTKKTRIMHALVCAAKNNYYCKTARHSSQ